MKRLLVFIVLAFACAATAAAQSNRSSWGVTGSIVPTWTVPPSVKVLFDADAIDIDGSEFRIGVVRGRELGGDWGVTYIRKTVKGGSFVEQGTGTLCAGVNNTNCLPVGSRYVMQDVALTGLEIHKFVPFVTIKRRAQIGMNFAGGVAWSKGQIVGTINDVDWSATPPVGIQRTEQVSFNDLLVEGRLKAIPLAKIEVAAGAIVAPGLKVRFSGGFNFPGYHVGSVTFVYLFGSR
jgi:hypothetical protein